MGQVVEALRRDIGRLPDGAQLPSTRALMKAHSVSPTTVVRAVALLVAEGSVVSQSGRGIFVRRRPHPDRTPDTSWQTVALGAARADAREVLALVTPPDRDAVIMSGGYPSKDLQPIAALAAATARAARRPGAWSQPPVQGVPELRQIFASLTASDPANVLIVAGGQAGLSAALKGLAPPGSSVLVEVPTYLGALAAMRAVGLRPIPIPTDDRGLRSDLLAHAFASTGARLLYLQPTFANPTGTVLAPERRAEVLAAARDAGAFIVEDDWARYLALDGVAPPPLLADDEDGHVVHLSSLTKAAAPSLRIGALVARGPAIERLAGVRLLDDFGVARPLQEAAVELLSSSSWPRHLTQLRTALRRRRNHLVGELRQQLPGLEPVVPPRGGLHLWQRLPDGVDDTRLVEAARAHNLILGAGRSYFVTEPPGSFLRLSFAQDSEDRLSAGVSILAELLAQRVGRD